MSFNVTKKPDNLNTSSECVQSLNSSDSLNDLSEKITKAIEIAVRYGGTDGAHHKAWVIDQMVRDLSGENYKQLVEAAKAGEDGPETYEWDEGIAP